MIEGVASARDHFLKRTDAKPGARESVLCASQTRTENQQRHEWIAREWFGGRRTSSGNLVGPPRGGSRHFVSLSGETGTNFKNPSFLVHLLLDCFVAPHRHRHHQPKRNPIKDTSVSSSSSIFTCLVSNTTSSHYSTFCLVPHSELLPPSTSSTPTIVTPQIFPPLQSAAVSPESIPIQYWLSHPSYSSTRRNHPRRLSSLVSVSTPKRPCLPKIAPRPPPMAPQSRMLWSTVWYEIILPSMKSIDI